MEIKDLKEIIKTLDRTLTESLDIVLIGGAAMILHFGSKRATRDIDAILIKGKSTVLEDAVKKISESYNLPKNWLNIAAKGFIDVLPQDFMNRLKPLKFNLKKVNLFVLGRVDQIAMKIVALREQDLEDLEILIKNITEREKEILRQNMLRLEQIRPDWAQKFYYYFLEQGWKVS